MNRYISTEAGHHLIVVAVESQQITLIIINHGRSGQEELSVFLCLQFKKRLSGIETKNLGGAQKWYIICILF